MMRLTIAAYVCTVLPLGSALAHDAPFIPKSPPPSFGFVHALDAEKGSITILYPAAKPVQETAYKTERREKDGQTVEVKVPYTMTRMVMEVQLKGWSPKSGKASDGSGKPIAEADLWKRLKKGDTVLMMQGDTIDPAFLKVLQPGAVILHAPPPSPPALVPPPAAPPAPPAKKNEGTEFEEQVLELVNAERKQAGLAALNPQQLLMTAARAHSANMAKQSQLSHDLDGKGPGERLDEIGYRHGGWGENCAVHQRTPEQLVTTWMNSPGHKANILNGGFTEAGIGAASNGQGVPYHTLVLAVPSGAPAGPAREAARPAGPQPKAARLLFRMPADAVSRLTINSSDSQKRPARPARSKPRGLSPARTLSAQSVWS